MSVLALIVIIIKEGFVSLVSGIILGIGLEELTLRRRGYYLKQLHSNHSKHKL